MSNAIPYAIQYVKKLQEKILENIEVVNWDYGASERIEAQLELEKNIKYFFFIQNKNEDYIARKFDSIQATANSLKFNL